MKKIILFLLALNIVGAFIAGCKGADADAGAESPKDAAAAEAASTE